MTAYEPRRAGVAVALATVSIDAIGVGIIFPVMPDLLLSLGLEDIGEAALWGGALATLYALMQFLCSPLLGALSDRYGRRMVMLCSLAAMAVDYAILSVAGGLWVLLIGRAVAGAAGATYGTATAYIADVSKPADRARRFGLVGAVFGLGFVLGPALGGAVGELHVRAPFMLAAVMAASNFVLAVIFLRESLPLSRRRAFDWRRANPLGAMRRALGLPALRWLLVGYFLFALGNHVYPVIWGYWSKFTFGWSVGTIGLSLATYGVAMALVQGGLIRPSVSWFGEARTVAGGLVIGAVVAVGFAFIDAGWMAFALTPIAALSDLATPALTGLMANRVADDEQGELQGVLASLMAVASVLAPPMASGLFYRFTASEASWHLPGAPFLLSALLIALAVPLMWRSLFPRSP